jgi:hypothetical protein
MKRVFVAHDPIEAHFIKDLLIRDGIEAEVLGDALFGLRPEIGFGSDNLPAVWIANDARVKDALELIAEYERDKKADR